MTGSEPVCRTRQNAGTFNEDCVVFRCVGEKKSNWR